MRTASAMDCATATELLPWLVNGSLAGSEREAALAHLKECPACQRELEGTGLAWIVYAQHVPSELLVAHALGDELPAGAAGTIEAHLARCAQCAAEAALVARGERLAAAPAEVGAGTVGSATRRGDPAWRYVALAAGLAAVVGLSGWLWSWRALRSGEAAIARLAVAKEATKRGVDERDARIAELRRALAATEARLAALGAPTLNPVVVELVPTGLRLRGEGAATRSIRLPAGASSVTLLLASETAGTFDGYALEVRGERGGVLWRGEGLTRRATRDFTVRLPAELLAGARVRLVVLGRRGDRWIELEAYDARFERTP